MPAHAPPHASSVKRTDVWKNYGVLQIEPTDFCNLRCAMCAPQLKNLETLHGDLPKGFIDVHLFHKIVDDLRHSRVCFDHLIFQWLGDPTLHPALPELVSYAHTHIRDRFQYFRIDSNAIAWTPSRLDRLIDVYLQDPLFPILLVFSIDAVTPETYQRVKGAPGRTLERVERNIEHFLQRRKELTIPSVNLNCEFQFVLQPGNAFEVREFIDHWDQRLARDGWARGYNEIMIKRLSVGAGARGQKLADQLYDETLAAFGIEPFSKPHLHLKIWEERPWETDVAPVHSDRGEEPPGSPGGEAVGNRRGPCPGLWMTPVIRWDGQLMACCADVDGEIEVGSLRDATFEELWEGPKMNAYRIRHILGEFERIPRCLHCGGINFYKFDAEAVRRWLGEIGRSDLFETYRERMGIDV